jgi:hypothetical protein
MEAAEIFGMSIVALLRIEFQTSQQVCHKLVVNQRSSARNVNESCILFYRNNV